MKKPIQTLGFVACVAFAAQAIAFNTSQTSITQEENRADRDQGIIRFIHGSAVRPYPFENHASLIFLKGEIDGKSVNILLDNGSTSTILSEDAAQRLDIETFATNDTIETSLGQLQKRKTGLVELKVPTQFQILSSFSVVDFSEVSRALGRDIDLILGNNILGQIGYLVDPTYESLIFAKSGGLRIDAGLDEMITTELSEGRFDAKINGSPARLLIDLGSNYELTVFEHSWAKFFAGRDAEAQASKTMDAGGNIASVPFLTGINLKVSDFSTSVVATQGKDSDASSDGHVGTKFFRNSVVIIDEKAGFLFFGKRPSENAGG